MKLKEIGAFEAKTKLSELLEKVERGESFQITKRGKPVAVLTPVSEENEKTKEEISLVELSRRIRAQSRPGKETIKELIHMGHKF